MIAAAILVAVVALVAVGVWVYSGSDRSGEAGPVPLSARPGEVASAQAEPGFERLTGPPRTVLRDAAGAIAAVFTDGARTVVITGPKRTFREPEATAASINTAAWVRLAPQPWQAGEENAAWFEPWFTEARQDTGPDVLAVAAQYLIGEPEEQDAEGVRFRGDASFGPVKATGAGRQEQSDFYDYLGTPWTFPDTRAQRPDADRYGAVDCSGYIRLVFGYRLGMPLLGTNTEGPGIPRRAYAISEFGPGVALVPNTRARATAYDLLQPGDLVFFEVEDDPAVLDHVGIYFGLDDRGHHRFISSRERINGPTLGDVGGTSLLDDGGYYSTAWRSARRL
ncbi:NlpC/P60 family protein [Actinokineospora sp.]|uniref:NlpC/P60 family protein n=1 Tax=Actinokineospora sp. TaxID=1872133 RepID=UPI004037716F